MRTTINLPDDLLRRAKVYAAEHELTLTDLIGDALRKRLGQTEHGRGAFALEPFDGDGLLPGVDLDDNAATRDLLDRS